MSEKTLLSRQSSLYAERIPGIVNAYGTPIYVYDENMIIAKCQKFLSMANGIGIKPRYAMKANSNKAILQLISGLGLGIDASSLNEVRRAYLAGIAFSEIMLTTQENPVGEDRRDLENMLLQGLRYNVCSVHQLALIADFASQQAIPLSIRIHPGVGSGESSTRNTGDKYSCFGIHLTDIEQTLDLARQHNIIFDGVHVHIGSGGDPQIWRENIDLELGFIERYFPDAQSVSFGGGFREARMPDETPADLDDLGTYAKERIEAFYQKTGRKLRMEVEPGTYIMANAGYLITTIIDQKQTGPDGFRFLVLDGGMEVNIRPLLYGSRHPFYLVSKQGKLIFSEFDSRPGEHKEALVIVGRCCESGDSQTLTSQHQIMPRLMAVPEIGDYLIIGGTGAYCTSMTPFNYNSHVQAPELLYRQNGSIQLIRKQQTLEQIIRNEYSL